MQTNDFTITFFLDQAPGEVFDAVNNVRGWWSETLEGSSVKLNDEFSYRHGDFHYSKHKIIELVPNVRIVWLTLESRLTFVKTQSEWDGTKMIFDISKHDEKTILIVTHMGLVPEFECFNACSKGWTHYLQNSLLPLITTGKGNPDKISNR